MDKLFIISLKCSHLLMKLEKKKKNSYNFIISNSYHSSKNNSYNFILAIQIQNKFFLKEFIALKQTVLNYNRLKLKVNIILLKIKFIIQLKQDSSLIFFHGQCLLPIVQSLTTNMRDLMDL